VTRKYGDVMGVLLRGGEAPIDLPAADAVGRFFPWGTPVDGRGCRAASQVLNAATREPVSNLADAADIRARARKRDRAWVAQMGPGSVVAWACRWSVPAPDMGGRYAGDRSGDRFRGR